MSDRPPVQSSVFVGSDTLRPVVAREHNLQCPGTAHEQPGATPPNLWHPLGWWIETYTVARGRKVHEFLRVAWRDPHGRQERAHIPRAAEAMALRMQRDRRTLGEVLEAIAEAPRVRQPGERG